MTKKRALVALLLLALTFAPGTALADPGSGCGGGPTAPVACPGG
jgi:hypothetical protein